jgi:putative oxygen-independent coproporphyrinogen III oxidase
MTDTPAGAEALAPTPVSLYVHVPFCVSKCAYCDFYSLSGRPAEEYARFVDAVLFEAGHWSHYDLLDDVPTLYLGGGTPTQLGPELVRLVRGLRETAALRPGAEITVETNPETTDAEIVAALADAGVNRFSIGVQSFDDGVLHTLGRCHDAARASRALDVLRRADVSFSLDLICGVPGQTFASWDDTLERAVASGARHVSVYPLTVEEGTPLAGAVADGRMPAPDPDAAADMMLAAEVALDAAGLRRYEVANYAQPGHESRHNTVYWTGGAYLGAGPHAASMLPYPLYARVAEAEGWALPDKGAARVRFVRESDVAGYVRRPLEIPGTPEYLSAPEAAREDVMLGLRLSEGVTVEEASRAGVGAVLERLESLGLVRLATGADGVPRWSTTQRGWLLGNEVFGAVWSGE